MLTALAGWKFSWRTLNKQAYERQVANDKLSPSTLAGYPKAITERMQAFALGRPIAAVKPSSGTQ